MCTYEYALNHNHRSIGVKCPYPDLYSRSEAGKASGLENLALDSSLPLDSRGMCIFHSDDVGWKREYQFTVRFFDLLLMLDSMDKESDYLDFVEFVFTGEDSNAGASGDRAFRIADHVFGREVKFSGARFLDRAEFNHVNFKGGASFKGANFERGLRMRDSSFRGVLLDDMAIDMDASFERIEFLNSYAIFGDTKFRGRVRFEESRFEGLVDFSGASFTPRSSLEAVSFSDVKFEDFVNFENVTFDCQTKFERVSFGANAEFVDVDFKVIKSSYRYRGRAVEFVDIEVGENGLLVFESTDPRNKIFKQDAVISFKGPLQGMVRFENVNFHQISDSSRKALLQLSKLGKVEIGPGCIKYRLQTEIRTIEVEEGNQALTLEIAQTFANYFTAKNGKNLGLEILEREKGRVSFFYFSDEDLSEEEFVDMLKGTEANLWEMLAANADDHYLLTAGRLEGDSSAGAESSVINTIDGVSALLGTFFRVGVRVAFGRWSVKDTRNLLDVVDFDGRQGRFEARNLHGILLNRYTGRTLLEINSGQNQDLISLSPSVRSQTGRYLGSAREFTGDVVDVGSMPKTKILFLGANPPGSRTRLDLDKEVDSIQANLERSKERDTIDFKKVWVVTADKLMQSILDESPYIVHISGHGRKGGIVLQDEEGRPKAVTAEALSSLFELFKESVNCVVLNSCFSESQAKAIRFHIPHVIGMKSKIPDDAAIAFSTGFYKAIGAGKEIPFAFNLGVVAIKLAGVSVDDAPVMV